jgi:hypothetical protein
MVKITIGLLVSLYLITLYLALHPKVSEQYFNYYIAKTTDLTKVDQDRMVDLKLNQLISSDTNHIFFDRWAHPRPGARLSKGNHPAIFFSLDQPEIDLCKCALELKITPLWPQLIQISVNGNIHYDQVLKESSDIYIVLTKKDLKPGLNKISFKLESAKKLNFSDKHKSAIEFSSLTFH